ncbi:MAG: DNA-binding protein [Polyangiaceae bacterium]
MAETNDLIRAHVDAFVADLTDLIHQSILDNVQTVLGQALPAAPRRPGRPKAITATAAGTPAKKAGKRGGKRTAAELNEMAEKLVEFVRSNPGTSIEEIGKGIAIPTKELALPVKKLLAEGRLKKKGQKRATRYSAGRK